MKTCLLVVNRPFKSDFASLYGQVAHIKDDYDKFIFLHPYKTEKVLDHLPLDMSKVQSISYADTINKCYKKTYTTWYDFYQDFDLDVEFDDIWFFGGLLTEGGKLKRKFGNTLDKELDKHGYMNFISVCKSYVIAYMLLKLANKNDAQIYEVCYDPGEFALDLVKDPRIKPKKNVIVFHGYDIPHLNISRLDSFQTYLKTSSVTRSLEFYDFAFGYSYMTKEREETHNTIQELYNAIDSEYDKVLYCKNKIEDKDNFLPRDEYMGVIANSDFTLIMPAYEDGCFSIYRLLESVHYECLPLIHESCNIKDVQDSFGINLLPYVVNKDNINMLLNMSDRYWDQNLEYLRETLKL